MTKMEPVAQTKEEMTDDMPYGLTRRRLTESDAPAFSALLTRQPDAYLRFFNAFGGFDVATIGRVLAAARKDLFGGVYQADEMVGFFMLRGWDEGYEVPAMGLLFDERFRGIQGFKLMVLTVEIGKEICRQRGASRLMYKSHPEHTPSRGAAHMGFTQTGVDERGFGIFHSELSVS